MCIRWREWGTWCRVWGVDGRRVATLCDLDWCRIILIFELDVPSYYQVHDLSEVLLKFFDRTLRNSLSQQITDGLDILIVIHSFQIVLILGLQFSRRNLFRHPLVGLTVLGVPRPSELLRPWNQPSCFRCPVLVPLIVCPLRPAPLSPSHPPVRRARSTASRVIKYPSIRPSPTPLASEEFHILPLRLVDPW